MGKIGINWNRQWAKWAGYGLTVVGREQSNLTYNSANYQWRKRAQQPDIQYFSLCHRLLLERSTATWLTTVQTTSKGRKQSDLTYNISHCIADRCWKKAKQPDGQHYLQLHRLLLEGSKVTWWTTLSAAAQTVVGREHSGLTPTQT